MADPRRGASFGRYRRLFFGLGLGLGLEGTVGGRAAGVSEWISEFSTNEK